MSAVMVVGPVVVELEYDEFRRLMSAGPAEQKLLVELMVADGS